MGLSKLVEVTSAVPLDSSRVAVRFDDGYSGVLDMSAYQRDWPAYRKLRDPSFFATARAGLCTVIWGDGSINVAPEVAREEAVPLAA